jgi:hypothetical protein
MTITATESMELTLSQLYVKLLQKPPTKDLQDRPLSGTEKKIKTKT